MSAIVGTAHTVGPLQELFVRCQSMNSTVRGYRVPIMAFKAFLFRVSKGPRCRCRVYHCRGREQTNQRPKPTSAKHPHFQKSHHRPNGFIDA